MNYSDYIRGVHLLCRICLGKSTKTISLAEVRQRIENMGEGANVVKISEDLRYPQNICMTCFNGLDYFTDLKAIYEKSQRILKKYIRLNDENVSTDVEIKEKVIYRPASSFKFTKRNWRCRYCYMDFKNEPTFKNHAKRCKKALQLKCEYCGKMFLSHVCKRYHIKLKHERPRPQPSEFKCDMCDEVFAKSSLRAYHKLTRHNRGLKSFDCEICGKSFLIKGSLLQHLESHNKDASVVVCPICGKSFHYRGGLFYHMKVHMNERNYLCSYCDRRFLNMTALKRHVRTHTGERPYKCHMCPKCFSSGGELKLHIMRHTGQRPHSCKFCGKPYVSTYNLKVHMASHQGDCPCEYCKKSFLNAEVLQAHMDIKHKGKKTQQRKEEYVNVYDEEFDNFNDCDLTLDSDS